jgi:DNA-binding NtrC family response regulator
MDASKIVYSFDNIVTLAELERMHIKMVLHQTGQNKPLTAKKLGIALKTLYNKLNEYAKVDTENNGTGSDEPS